MSGNLLPPPSAATGVTSRVLSCAAPKVQGCELEIHHVQARMSGNLLPPPSAATGVTSRVRECVVLRVDLFSDAGTLTSSQFA